MRSKEHAFFSLASRIVEISDSPDFLNAKQVQIRPNTDTALMLSLAFILIKKDSYNKDFIKDYTVGFDSFADYVLGKKDSQECSAEWASSITSIPVKTIYELADLIVTKKTMISIKGPGGGILTKYFDVVVGRKAKNNIEKPWTWTKGIRTGLDADGKQIGPTFTGLPKLANP